VVPFVVLLHVNGARVIPKVAAEVDVVTLGEVLVFDSVDVVDVVCFGNIEQLILIINSARLYGRGIGHGRV
jgi:hypothetical protein